MRYSCTFERGEGYRVSFLFFLQGNLYNFVNPVRQGEGSILNGGFN